MTRHKIRPLTRLALILCASALVAVVQVAIVAPAFRDGGAEADAPAPQVSTAGPQAAASPAQ